MANFINIPSGLKIPSQFPLDPKTRSLSEATLKDLGINNNLAYTYYKGLEVLCLAENKTYIWDRADTNVGVTKLLVNNFVYPDNFIVDDIVYSNKAYNFFLKPSVPKKVSELQNDSMYITLADVPPGTIVTPYTAGTGLSLANYQFSNTAPDKVVSLQGSGSVTVTGTYPNFNIAAVDTIANGSETKINAGSNVTITGTGTTESPYIITSVPTTVTGAETKLISGSNITITGVGTVASPYTISSTPTTYTVGDGLKLTGNKIEIDNLQRVLLYPADFTNNNYTLKSTDNNYELIIDNATTAVTITAPIGLTSKFGVGITHKGSADISFTTSGGAIIRTPLGLKSKGQFYQTYLSQEQSTNVFYLGGNTKL